MHLQRRVRTYIQIAIGLLCFSVSSRASPSTMVTFPVPDQTRMSCAAAIEYTLSSLPEIGTCHMEYKAGQFVCIDFSLKFCEGIEKQGDPTWHCSILRIQNTGDKAWDCATRECHITKKQFQARQCTPSDFECISAYLAGHAINLVRLGGEKRLKTYGWIGFVVIEPQTEEQLCTWTQTTLNPIVTQACKDKLRQLYFKEQFDCGVSQRFSVSDSKLNYQQ